MIRTSATPRALERATDTISRVAILSGVLMRLVLVFVVPVGGEVRHRLEGLNDEPAHLHYVEYLAREHALPVQTHGFAEPGAFARADFEYYQPPLYYVLGAVLASLVGPARALLACRLLSAVCGLATLGLLWIVLRSSPLPRGVRLPAMAFGCLWLTHAFFCAVVSNDALSWLLASCVVALVVTRPPARDGKPDARRAIALALSLGLGLLTKSTLIVLMPALAILYGVWSVRARRPSLLLEGVLVLGVASLIAAPWYLHNLARYGSLLGLEMGFGAEPRAGLGGLLVALIAGTNRYFWFPMQHVVSPAARALRAVGLVLLGAHLVAGGFYAWRRRSDLRETALAIVLILVVLGYGAANLRWFAPETRFLLPAFIPIVYGLAAGASLLAARPKGERLAGFELIAIGLIPFVYLALA